jgi:hypothetical protein
VTTPTSSSLAQVNGIELGYQSFGEGVPLLLNTVPALSAAVIPFLDGA